MLTIVPRLLTSCAALLLIAAAPPDQGRVGYVIDDFNRSLVSAEAIAAAEDARRKIIAGQTKVTDAMAQ